MSDIIDINVAQTVEEVTINVTEEVIQVNINTINGGGGIESVVAGTNITVDNTDPLNPIINANADAVTSVNSDTGAVIVDLPSVLAQGNRTIYEADATYTTQAIDKGRFIFVVNGGVTIFIDGDNYEIGDELEIYNEKPSENLQIVLNSPANFAQGNSDFELEPFCKSIIKKIDTNFWYYNIIRVQNPTTPSLKEVLAVEGRMIFEVSSDYTFESSNKSETIIINTASAVDLFLEDGTFLDGDEIEIYNKLSTNARIRVVGIESAQIFYKDEIIDADMLNTVTLPLYSKSWLKCVSTFPTIIFELVIIEQNDAITIDATPTDGSSNAVSSNGVFDALALKQNKLFSSVNTTATSALTGTLTETIMYSVLIPANTLSSNSNLEVNLLAINSNPTATINIRYYINTINSLSGATQVGTVSSNVRFYPFRRTFLLKPSNVFYGFNFFNNSVADTGLSSAVPSSTTYTITSDYYIIATIQLTNTADSLTGQHFSIIENK